MVGQNISFVTAGNFESDTLKSIVAGTEVAENNLYGIKFYLISWVDGEFQIKFSTNVLNGSFIQCMVNKIKFSDFNNELIYYNSKNYFMGTGGGDVYSYIVDFRKREVYSAHLFAGEGTKSVLYLSENVEDRMLRQFFISYFRKDYPSLKVIQSDN